MVFRDDFKDTVGYDGGKDIISGGEPDWPTVDIDDDWCGEFRPYIDGEGNPAVDDPSTPVGQ
jgi:hypothetical protein